MVWIDSWSIVSGADGLSRAEGCRVMPLARSSYYYRPRGRRRDDEAELGAHIEAICECWPAYGYRRVSRQLEREGRKVNHKRVARIIRAKDLQTMAQRRFVVTSDGAASAPFPDLARDLRLTGTDRLWVADLTSIRIVAGFVFLAVILDACSRRVVGYPVHGLVGSIGRRGNLYDNAKAESSIKTLEHEEST